MQVVGAGWKPDPSGRHQERFYDGQRWTVHVKDGEQHAMDDPDPGLAPPTSLPAPTGGPRRSILTAPAFVVRQRAKLVELVNEYDVVEPDGAHLATVRQFGQSRGAVALRSLTGFDPGLTQRLEVVDTDGSLAMTLSRVGATTRSTDILRVTDGLGRASGSVRPMSRIGKRVFGLEVEHGFGGYLRAEDWLSRSFTVEDRTGRIVARSTQRWRGATELFTTADTYAVEVVEPVQGGMRVMVVAAALAIDSFLKQTDMVGHGIALEATATLARMLGR